MISEYQENADFDQVATPSQNTDKSKKILIRFSRLWYINVKDNLLNLILIDNNECF